MKKKEIKKRLLNDEKKINDLYRIVRESNKEKSFQKTQLSELQDRIKELENSKTILKDAKLDALEYKLEKHYEKIVDDLIDKSKEEKPEKFKILIDWEKQFPKSFYKFWNYFWGEDLSFFSSDYNKGIWDSLNDILDYFDKNTCYKIDIHVDPENDFMISVCDEERCLIHFFDETREKVFLTGLNKLLEHYEKTL
jgi:hypothetical protein